MPIKAVLVDLGGTLVDFFPGTSAARMLPECFSSVLLTLSSKGLPAPSSSELEARWAERRREPSDLMARPLEDRLSHVFDIDPKDLGTIDEICRAFMRPVFAGSRRFEDAIPFLASLKSQGIRTVLVSNTAWGSPAHLWREQLIHHDLDTCLDGSVFCRDVGWRKPDPRIFDRALELAGVMASECLFVGDDPVWDVEGPSRKGIRAALLDRRMEWAGQRDDRVNCLADVMAMGLLDR